MTDRIADALVLVFTPGVSLREWESIGLLEREWALYEHLRPFYSRIILVTYGKADDLAILARLGPDVDVVCNSPRLEWAEFVQSIPRRVAEVLRAAQTVIVKTNQLPAGPAAMDITAALRATRPPGTVGLIARGGYLASRFVARDRGPASSEARKAGAEELALCRHADVIVGTTREMLDDLAWRYSVDPGAMRLIPNYVIADSPAVGVSERLPGLVLYSGQLTARKRVDVVIEAVAGLPEPLRSSVTLRIVGQGPEEARLRALASQHRIRCEFRGRMPHRELLEQMALCAVYVQASDLEGHPKTVLEAMSTGAPVMVADSPGLGNVVQNGATGLRVPGTPEAFSQSLAALLADEDWRELLGSAAARVTRAALGIDRIAELEVQAHREAMSLSSRARGDSADQVRWEPELVNAQPSVAADRWMHSLEAFARRLSEQGRAELITRLEASLRQSRTGSAA